MHLREKRNGQENEKTNQAGRWQGRCARRFEDPLLVFVSDRGPVHLWEQSVEEEKENKTNQKKKKRPRTRFEAMLRRVPEPGGEGGISQSEARERAASCCRDRLRTRDTGGDATRGKEMREM